MIYIYKLYIKYINIFSINSITVLKSFSQYVLSSEDRYLKIA